MSASAPERLAILAHELRSPVAALAALAEAKDRIRDAGGRRRLVELAIAAARDIERLVSDPALLSLREEPVDVAALASGFAGPLVEVRATEAAIVDGDSTRLRQVLANLVENGLRHGGRVSIDVERGGGLVVVEVSDDGPGLAEGLDPFARGVGAAGSTGYGLWLARAIAERHGGSLHHVADDGPGARFRLALPSASAGS